MLVGLRHSYGLSSINFYVITDRAKKGVGVKNFIGSLESSSACGALVVNRCAVECKSGL